EGILLDKIILSYVFKDVMLNSGILTAMAMTLTHLKTGSIEDVVLLDEGGVIVASENMLNSKVKRLQRALNQLETQRATAVKDESNSIKKVNRANSSIKGTNSEATIKSKSSEIEKENNKIHKLKKKQADALTKISNKNVELNKALTELGKVRQE